jgi:hypothetical protein
VGQGATPAPLPPDAGNTSLSAQETGWLAGAAGLLAVVVALFVLGRHAGKR